VAEANVREREFSFLVQKKNGYDHAYIPNNGHRDGFSILQFRFLRAYYFGFRKRVCSTLARITNGNVAVLLALLVFVNSRDTSTDDGTLMNMSRLQNPSCCVTFWEFSNNGYVMAFIMLISCIAQGSFSQASTHILNVEGIRLKSGLQVWFKRYYDRTDANNSTRVICRPCCMVKC